MNRWTKARRPPVAIAAGLPAVGVLFALAGAACGSGTSASGAQPETAKSSEGGGGGGGGSAESGPSGDASGGSGTVSLTWQVISVHLAGSGNPDAGQNAGDGGQTGVSDVTVCVHGHGEVPCVTTASDGTFVLPGLPPATDVAVTFNKDGYISVLKPIETARTDMQTTNPIAMARSSDPTPDVGFPIDRQQKGAIVFFAIAPPPDGGAGFTADLGATATLTPASGNGPLYVGENNFFDAGLMSITPGGIGEYFNVDPGDYTLTIHDSKHDCAPISFPFGGWGYPSPPQSVKFPVLAGYATAGVGFFCTAKIAIVATDAARD
jgi:hypothetical protein